MPSWAPASALAPSAAASPVSGAWSPIEIRASEGDEPVAGMNPSEKQVLIAAFDRVRKARDVAFLLVEHDMSFVMSLTEYLYVLDFGKVIAEGRPQEVAANARVIEAYLGGGSRAED